jgi:hypothetical protein
MTTCMIGIQLIKEETRECVGDIVILVCPLEAFETKLHEHLTKEDRRAWRH